MRQRSGLFIAEGTSDLPLADLVEALFLEQGVSVRLSKPDFGLLERSIKKDVRSKLEAGCQLAGQPVDVLVVHRDADNAGPAPRRQEIAEASAQSAPEAAVIPVVPVRMTEAWLLLDEAAIRQVAGNPKGRSSLGLPNPREAERVADPKKLLAECLAEASGATGRRRKQMAERFPQHRRQLLERLDPFGPVTRLESWKQLVADVEDIVASWTGR
ncbi:DUF4276 family protein [Longispora albida]|uniref:DUF4276 family protein n=1 Tax=Longispora albida TaxID=203523 RepID=UPI001B7F932F|nr:DUF4276 family protein [Longispora albida]